ncbi:M24 family metallopeptidase [Candidatus Woesearchaeota archaeon]|nr:M24 family metallopeptidase [Candidatus Woesearchaeota archaeon]
MKTNSGVKSKREIAFIQRACNITDGIFKELIKNFRFKTEKDVAKFIRKKIKENKCRMAFRPIVASGKNASNPHHKPTDKKLTGFIIIDFGVKYKGYCSDMSRTIFVGTPTKEHLKLYKLVLEVQRDSIKKIRKGVKCDELHEYSIKSFGNHKKYFIHALGHGLGKKIHENPSIGKKKGHIFENNMVFTVEPGIYIKNRFGIRIEDTLLLNKTTKLLTKSRKDLLTF